MLLMLDKYLREIATWHEPTGGFYIWVHIKVPISYRSLFDKALQEKVLLNPVLYMIEVQINFAPIVFIRNVRRN